MSRKSKKTWKQRREAKLQRRNPREASFTWEDTLALYKAGRMAEAHEACKSLLREQPDFAEAWHLFGLLSFHLDDPETAAERVREAIRRKPEYAAAYNDLGNVLSSLSRYAEAEVAYRDAIRLAPDDARARSNLGGVLRRQDRPEEAVEHCQEAVKLNPVDGNARYNLACALRDCGRRDEAVRTFHDVLVADPEHADVHRQLCAMLQRMGRHDDARDVCEQWLEREPSNAVAQHLLAAFTGAASETRASDAYIRQVFDEFAEKFDTELRELGYQAPDVLADALKARIGQVQNELDVLDAGCGTGWCGEVLRPYAKSLIGVDLSGGMLSQAEQRQTYDRLVEAEITAYLSENPQQFDLIVACDTFNYFGDFKPLLAAVHNALRPQGALIFTVEHSAEPLMDGFQLQTTGRYRHTQQYVEQILNESHFVLDSISMFDLRREAGQPVEAAIVEAHLPIECRAAFELLE